jgi:tetratricopeptide (TPR) repeat protein
VTADGVPRLLDFGIAKLLDPDMLPEIAETTGLLRCLTPEYASPEQIRGDPISTASDVYSLGVVLHRLLTGFGPHRLTGMKSREIEHVICEQEPRIPSTAVVSDGDVDGERSRVEAERLQRQLRGDLDNIVIKTLDKEPDRRYASAAELSEDIRCHLVGLPVLARETTILYRTAKFIRRHRVSLLFGALLFVVLPGGIVATSWQAKKAIEVRRQLPHVDEIVIAEDPDHLGEMYYQLQDHERSERICREALEIKRRVLDEDDPRVGNSLFRLAHIRWAQMDYESPERLFRQALRIQRQASREPTSEELQTLRQYGRFLQDVGRYTEARAVFDEGFEVARELYSEDDHLMIAHMHGHLAGLLQDRGDYAAAKVHWLKKLAIFRKRLGPTHHQTLIDQVNYVLLLSDKGEHDEALKVCDAALAKIIDLESEDDFRVGRTYVHRALI